jgi:hypothetical protein
MLVGNSLAHGRQPGGLIRSRKSGSHDRDICGLTNLLHHFLNQCGTESIVIDKIDEAFPKVCVPVPSHHVAACRFCLFQYGNDRGRIVCRHGNYAWLG